jgi:hypothetical protein
VTHQIYERQAFVWSHNIRCRIPPFSTMTVWKVWHSSLLLVEDAPIHFLINPMICQSTITVSRLVKCSFITIAEARYFMGLTTMGPCKSDSPRHGHYDHNVAGVMFHAFEILCDSAFGSRQTPTSVSLSAFWEARRIFRYLCRSGELYLLFFRW